MGEYTSLKDHFLIAMPTLQDPSFAHSVIYICEHSEKGAMGIIVNLPLSIQLGDVFDNMHISSRDEVLDGMPILSGGPLQRERGFVLHKNNLKKWDSSLPINDELSITTSKDILEAIANNEGPDDMVIALGYAGWQPGQLEKELSENSWLFTPASSDILFNVRPEDRWHAAGNLIGVDMNSISFEVGHA